MDLQKALREERTKLHAELEELDKQKAQIDDKISLVRGELKAIDAYELAKTGKKKTVGKRNAGIRQQLVDTIKASPQGLRRAEILEQINPEKDKTIEHSVSNALSALKRQGKLSANDGVYTIG